MRSRSIFILLLIVVATVIAIVPDPDRTPTNDLLISLPNGSISNDHYSYSNAAAKHDNGNYTIILAMSGGGSRASAFSYGVLKALKEQIVTHDGIDESLLSEVDVISAVSGGSFTAAYYGLYGDKIFTNFEEDFLSHDVGTDLFWRAFSPRQWLSFNGRTDEVVGYYREKLFADATFADFNQEESPLIIINATDMGGGVHFPFIQEYFDLLCTDLSSYSVASAVAASSAVPVLFSPILLKNHEGCDPPNLLDLESSEYASSIEKSTVEGLKSYSEKSKRQYVHLVDGGITDNLGLVAIRDLLTAKKDSHLKFNRSDIKSHIMVISIDASVKPFSKLDSSSFEPNLATTIDSMTDIQIHRYNDVSKSLIKETIKQAGQRNSSPGTPVSSYFVDINLKEISDKSEKDFFNNIPTDLCLPPETIDALIAQGISQLANNEEYRRFLSDIRQ
ncbi:patatin-like phospholipase family protein [Vibrio hannami]|uniref:patatin-like phospholipase family protein n=1 Tax=Vibrio hannami TaxID=2717094 RepID=UPI00240FB598|nr:patatin-like phospholipase family protein [Vibrio hannami]MDG3085072.1 patatin-like phospholipase family protein [Vibrio hannami]